MSSLRRQVGVGALVLCGVLAGQQLAQAQFSFGQTRYGMNTNNPFIAQQQFLSNLQAGRLAIATGQQVPAALPYLAQAYGGGGYNPYVPPAFAGGAGYNPYMTGYGNPYMTGYGANAYSPLGGGLGSNPYSPAGGYDASGSNPYSPIGAGSPYGGGYGLPSSVGPGYTLSGGADLLRATGQVWKDEEQARIMRQQYYQAKLDTKKKQFDLDMYIKANTPTFTETELKTQRLILSRILKNSSPAEISEGRSLNMILNDIATKFHDNKAPMSEIPLDESVLQRLNIASGAGGASFGLLRNGDKLIWPSALTEIVPAEVRANVAKQAQALAKNAIDGKEPDGNAIRDLRGQIEKMQDKLLSKANDFGTPDYMAGQRFLNDLLAATRAISSGAAAAQVDYQRLVSKGEIHNLNDLVKVMVTRGWRFAPALPSDEGAYRALHSALASYDVALNQLVAANEP